MKLNQLGSDFGLMNQKEQSIFFHKYIERRSIDLVESVIKKQRKAGSAKGKNIPITNEALEILKKLGLVL